MGEATPRHEGPYMSGYTEDPIAQDGVLDPGIAFTQKPGSSQVLRETARKLLEA